MAREKLVRNVVSHKHVQYTITYKLACGHEVHHHAVRRIGVYFDQPNQLPCYRCSFSTPIARKRRARRH